MTLLEKLQKDGYPVNPKHFCPYLDSLVIKYNYAEDYRPEKMPYYYHLIVVWISAPICDLS